MRKNQIDIVIVADRRHALFCHIGFPVAGNGMHRIAFTRFGKESLMPFHSG